MSSGFDEFTEAVSKSTTKKPVIESKSFSRIAVLGGGADYFPLMERNCRH